MRERFGDDQVRYLLGDVRDRARMARACPGRRPHRPRRGHEAGAGVRVQPLRGGADQRARRPARGRLPPSTPGSRRWSPCPPTRRSTRSTSTAPPSCAPRRSSSRATPTRPQSHTRLSCVRYGNVVGSRGSVVPLFQEQLDDGQAHDHRRADDPVLDHPAPGRRPGPLRPRAHARAARSSSRRSRRCGWSTWPRPWPRACPGRSSASAPARSCTRCSSPPTRAGTPSTPTTSTSSCRSTRGGPRAPRWIDGKPLDDGFVYSSDTNDRWLDVRTSCSRASLP